MALYGFHPRTDKLVAGARSAVADDNFRAWFTTEEQARGYIEEAFPGWEALGNEVPAAIVKRSVRPTPTKRRSLADLSPTTRRDYLGSAQAKAEAAANGFSVERWYEIAPDIKAFRRKGPKVARVFPVAKDIRYFTYISRDSSGTTRERLILSAQSRLAHLRNKRRGEEMKEQFAYVREHRHD